MEQKFKVELEVKIPDEYVLIKKVEYEELQHDRLAGREMERECAEIHYKNIIDEDAVQKGYTESFLYRATSETNLTKVYLNNDKKTFIPTYVLLHQERDTNFYRDKYSVRLTQDRLIDVPFPADKHKGYKYDFILRVFVCRGGQPAIPEGLEKSSLSKAFISELMEFPEMCGRYKVLEKTGKK